MELAFEEKKMPYLAPVAHQVLTQEETAESIVPDSCPDMERIVECTGRVLLRSKDCREGSVTVTGGIQAQILFQAEGENILRVLETYLPFSIRLENAALTGDAAVLCQCRIRSIDGRMQNPRKAMARVQVACEIAAFVPAEQSIWTLPETEGLEVRRRTIPLLQMRAWGEKSFAITEESELPSGQPAVAELLRWDVSPQLAETKLLGSRAVFKGSAVFHMLYRDAEGALRTWSFELPFSQYAELDQECGEDVTIQLVLTGAELEMDGQGEGRTLLPTIHLLAQCIAGVQEEVEIIEDLYSTKEQVTPQTQPLQAVSRLDLQQMRQNVRQSIDGAAKETLDATVYLDFPTQERQGETVQVTAPALVSVLYLDEDGQAQCAQRRMEVSCETQLHPDCQLLAQAVPAGESYATPTPDGMEVRFAADFTLESMAQETVDMVCGAEVSERPDTGEERPSVVIRAAAPGESLWALAKSCNTTVAAICAANGLDSDAVIAGTMLLIPVR